MDESALEQLLDQPANEEYLRFWSKNIEEKRLDDSLQENTTWLLFSIGDDHFAISSLVVGGVFEARRVQPVPHNKNPLLQGIVSEGGQLRLFVSLRVLLAIPEKKLTLPYMLLLEKEGEGWVIGVNSVHGVHLFERERMDNVPVTVGKSMPNYLKHIVLWREKRVGLLDEELVFFSLKRRLY